MQSWRRRAGVLLAAAVVTALAAALATPTLAATATADPSTLELEPVPYAMDSTNQAGWWNPIAEQDGTTYFAFDSPAPLESQHEIHLAQRSRSGDWTTGCLLASDGSCVRYNDDIGHHQPSIAIDGDGYLHAFVSMHGSRWRYYRSDEPGSVTLLDHSAELPDQAGAVTYPTTASTGSGDVYVMARVELFIDGQWEAVASVSGNQSNPAVVPVEASEPTDQVRLVLTDPSGYTGGSDLARVFEVEVYGTGVTP